MKWRLLLSLRHLYTRTTSLISTSPSRKLRPQTKNDHILLHPPVDPITITYWECCTCRSTNYIPDLRCRTCSSSIRCDTCRVFQIEKWGENWLLVDEAQRERERAKAEQRRRQRLWREEKARGRMAVASWIK